MVHAKKSLNFTFKVIAIVFGMPSAMWSFAIYEKSGRHTFLDGISRQINLLILRGYWITLELSHMFVNYKK